MTSQVFASESCDLLLRHNRCPRMTIFTLVLFLLKSFRKKGVSLVKFKSKNWSRDLFDQFLCQHPWLGKSKRKKNCTTSNIFFRCWQTFHFFAAARSFRNKTCFIFFSILQSKSFSSVWQQLGGETLVALATKNNNTDELVRIRMALVRVVKCPKLCPRRSRVRTPGACFAF